MKLKKVIFLLSGPVVAVACVAMFSYYRATGAFDLSVPDSLKGNQAGDLVAVTRIGKYPALAMSWALNQIDLEEPLKVDYGVVLYRLEYLTTQYNGTLITASGLLSVPATEHPASVISYQHGTSTDRHNVPSQAGLGEGLLVSAAAAGSGHVTVAADYIGLGQNYELHPYFYTRTTVSSSLDLLLASRSWLGHLGYDWPESLYLSGVSQGGHATMALHRALEEMSDPPFAVAASAPIVGAFQLKDISFPQAMTGSTDSHEMYLAYLATTYAKIYAQPLTSLLKAPYVDTIPPVFDGDHSSSLIRAVLPEMPRDMFSEKFLAAYDSDQPHWFLDALAENSVFHWTPKAPIRLYYGDNDVDVSPREAIEAEAAMSDRGADVTAISVGPWEHEEAALRAIPKALMWFNEMNHAGSQL